MFSRVDKDTFGIPIYGNGVINIFLSLLDNQSKCIQYYNDKYEWKIKIKNKKKI